MFNWLRYFPLCFRDAGLEPVVPVGPYFSKLRKQQWIFGDSVFHLSIPSSNAVYGPESYATKTLKPKSPENFDILQQQLRSDGLDNDALDRWHHGHLFLRQWLFVGPWFTGSQARLHLSASLIKQKGREDFNGTSFFHPRVFETVIADYLNSYFGHKKSARKPRYRGPLNWQVLPISSSIKAVCFDIHDIGITSKENPNLLRLVAFPVSDSQFILLKFNFGGTLVYSKERVDAVNMFKLTDAIMNSFSLEVGEQTQAKWNDVQKQCGDMSLTSEFSEFKWPIKPADIGKVQPTKTDDTDILKIKNIDDQ